jgi:nucleoside-diphosphate-sugar epimerase
MPVIVVGADTPLGTAIVEALLARQGEIRAFVSDADSGAALKKQRVKVAVGDISDGSHLEGAAMRCFGAVLMAEAATDGRALAFASGADDVYRAWTSALHAAGVTRTIWVGPRPDESTAQSLRDATAEVALVDPTTGTAVEIADQVAALDDAASL